MAVQNANHIIREARLKAGLTQEQMAQGVCSVKALSRIETETANASHATFQALMERAGASYSSFPVFDSRNDFNCFLALKHARFHLDAWQLTPAYEELQKLEEHNWADNRLYYQEWLLLHCQLQFRSYCCSHQQNFDTLLDTLHITRPDINLSDFSSLLLSYNEIQIITALAQEALYLDRKEICLQIHMQIDKYLADYKLALREKERLQAENAIIYAKYLIAAGDYESALEAVETNRHIMAVQTDTVFLFELTFLAGLCYYQTGEKILGIQWIKTAFYCAYSTESSYATACRNYLIKETNLPITGEMACCPDIPMQQYPVKKFTDSLSLSEGLYDAAVAGSYTLGSLIKDLRLEQKVSQDLLCRGLCSKSKLSKIENGSLQPDIMLSEAFLQRLGIPDRIFTFWGNEKETKFNDLKFILTHIHHTSEKTVSAFLDEMEQLLEKQDILYRQEWLFLKTINQCPFGQRIPGLTEALQLTLSNFNINHICSYRLTWCELSILNNLAHEYLHTSQNRLCYTYFSQIIAYINTAQPDILLQKNILPFTFAGNSRILYRQKSFQEILDFSAQIAISLMKYNINAYGTYLFFYSQALGECSHYENAEINAIYACALNEILEYHKNSAALKKYFKEDFEVTINY